MMSRELRDKAEIVIKELQELLVPIQAEIQDMKFKNQSPLHRPEVDNQGRV